MKINGHRTHLGERGQRAGGRRREVIPIAPRASPTDGLEVVWYPHRDAPSVLPPNLVNTETNYRQERGVIRVVPYGHAGRWSWLG